MTKKKIENIPINKYGLGAFAIDHCLKVIAILITIGIVLCILQIRTIQCGDTKIEKQPLKTQIKK